jgi:uncharacterized OB-fold protein
MTTIPLVEYLVLGDDPHLVAHECRTCQARYFDRRNACASCSGQEFTDVAVPTEGVVRSFTIVSMAAPGVPVPYAAAVVDCGGTSVRGNLVNVAPDPEHVTLGMKVRLTTVPVKVRLTTVPVGADAAGTEAVGFGFEPMEREGN